MTLYVICLNAEHTIQNLLASGKLIRDFEHGYIFKSGTRGLLAKGNFPIYLLSLAPLAKGNKIKNA